MVLLLYVCLFVCLFAEFEPVHKYTCLKRNHHLGCAAPVHQLKRYYVHGDIDDCMGHWGTLMSCLKQKTRFQDDGIRALEMPCLWALRTPEEASTFWEGEFVADDPTAKSHASPTHGGGPGSPPPTSTATFI